MGNTPVIDVDLGDVARKFRFDIVVKLLPISRLLAATPVQGTRKDDNSGVPIS
jgi:hypothetical protein